MTDILEQHAKQLVQDAVEAYAAACLEEERRSVAQQNAQGAYKQADEQYTAACQERGRARERLLFLASGGRAKP